MALCLIDCVPSSFGNDQVVLKKINMVSTIWLLSSLGKRRGSSLYQTWIPFYPRLLVAMFGINWPSGSGKEKT